MNNCPEIFAALSSYLDRELSPATCKELEEHLRDCPECVEFVDSLKRSIELCRQFGATTGPGTVTPQKLDELRLAYDRMMARRRESR